MEVSGASSAAAQTTTVAIEVQKKTEDVQAQNAATLIESVPDSNCPANVFHISVASVTVTGSH